MFLAMVSTWGVSVTTATTLWTLVQAGFGVMFILSFMTLGIGVAALAWGIRRMATWTVGDAVVW